MDPSFFSSSTFVAEIIRQCNAQPLLNLFQRAFGYEFSLMQQSSFVLGLFGQHLFIKAGTGKGKSAAALLPCLVQSILYGCVTIFFVPLTLIAVMQVEELQKVCAALGGRCVLLTSDATEQQRDLNDIIIRDIKDHIQKYQDLQKDEVYFGSFAVDESNSVAGNFTKEFVQARIAAAVQRINSNEKNPIYIVLSNTEKVTMNRAVSEVVVSLYESKMLCRVIQDESNVVANSFNFRFAMLFGQQWRALFPGVGITTMSASCNELVKDLVTSILFGPPSDASFDLVRIMTMRYNKDTEKLENAISSKLLDLVEERRKKRSDYGGTAYDYGYGYGHGHDHDHDHDHDHQLSEPWGQYTTGTHRMPWSMKRVDFIELVNQTSRIVGNVTDKDPGIQISMYQARGGAGGDVFEISETS